MKFLYTLVFTLFFYSLSFAQAPPGAGNPGFQGFNPETHDEMSPQQREAMYKLIKDGIKDLAKKGITAQSMLRKSPQAIKFGHPMRTAAGFTDNSYYTIYNYIDQDNTTGVKDYNCGNRTYDGHMGTDFVIFPFWWKKMEENSVEIVAAADGVIVAKVGHREDKVCVNCPADAPESCYYWNCVYLQHADGTLSMYGHMKKNSPTTKAVGETVTKGEYLGIVGSSGNSSVPHLHFEVWTDTTFSGTLLDPWKGNCNPTVTESLWDQQETYYKETVVKVMTGTALPEIKDCYDGSVEKIYEKKEFVIGDTVFLTTFLRDHRSTGSPIGIKILGPNNIKYEWSIPANTWPGYYAWLYFYYNYGESVFSVPGTWKFQVTYGTSFMETTFTMKDPLPLSLLSFTAKAANENVLLNWQTTAESNTSHFEIEHSTDGEHFDLIGNVATAGNGQAGKNDYSFNDLNPAAGTNFYRLKMIDIDGKFTYSKVEKVNVIKLFNVRVFPNPATNEVTVTGIKDFTKIRITNLRGAEMLSKNFNTSELKISIASFPAGVYLIQLSNESSIQNIKLIKK